MVSQCVFIFTWAVIAGLRLLPRAIGIFLVRTLALLVYYLDFHHRRVAAVNLKIAFPEFPHSQRSAIVRRSFQNTAMNLIEVSRLRYLNQSNISSLVQYDSILGLDNYKAAQSKGKGILYLTGHFSAWELLPAAHALYGYPLSFVTRPLDNAPLDRYVQDLRESTGNRVINKQNAMRPILNCLKNNEAVGILMDQNTSLQMGVFADFFSLPAATTTGIALLALRTEAPILTGYLTPLHNGRYIIKFLPPVEVTRTGDRNRDILINTERLNGILEGIIREQPESWLWGHKRWKNQPPGNPQDLYGLSEKDLDRFLNEQRKNSPKRFSE